MSQRMVTINLGAQQLIFDEDSLSNKIIKQFRVDVSKAVEDYDAKIIKIQDEFEVLATKYAEDMKKKDKETDKAYETRSAKLLEDFKAATDKLRPPEDNYWLQDLAFELLKVIGRLCNQEYKVTPENFEEAPWMPIKNTLARILLTHECPAGSLFLPPKLKEEE